MEREDQHGKDRQKCKQCEYKALAPKPIDPKAEGAWCYMFESFVPGCVKFKGHKNA